MTEDEWQKEIIREMEEIIAAGNGKIEETLTRLKNLAMQLGESIYKSSNTKAE